MRIYACMCFFLCLFLFLCCLCLFVYACMYAQVFVWRNPFKLDRMYVCVTMRGCGLPTIIREAEIRPISAPRCISDGKAMEACTSARETFYTSKAVSKGS